MSIPYMPLYVADFEADTAHLSTAEDGAFNRLLRLQWRTPGCTMPNDPEWIKRRVRASDEEWEGIYEPVLAEFFKVRRGRIFSARLLREWERVNATSLKRSSAGKKGGRPPKPLENKDTAESPAKANGKHLEPDLEPEPELKKTPRKPPRGGGSEFEADFAEWYALYPRKESKGAARKAYANARKKADAETLLAGLRRYCAKVMGKDQEFIAYPATWLNGERWLDEAPAPTAPADAAQLAVVRVERAKDWLSRNPTIPTWMDNPETAERLLTEGYGYDQLRQAGFTLPPRGNVVDISEVVQSVAEAKRASRD